MAKERVSSDIDKNLRVAIDAKANALGISRSKYIEIALKSELGRFNVHKENKRLTEARTRAEQETEDLRQKLTTAEDQIALAEELFGKKQAALEELQSEKTALTEQRDEFEKQLHAETDAYNKCNERAESLKKERNRFKAQAEEAKTKLDACSAKMTLLLARNWWERLWNVLPWVT